jgi:hypothetical protein
VNDFAAGRLNEVHPVIRVHIAILAHVRTPVRRDGAKLDICGKSCPDRNALSHGDRRDAFLHHVFSNAGALFRLEVDASADWTYLDTYSLGERAFDPPTVRAATTAAAINARFIRISFGFVGSRSLHH